MSDVKRFAVPGRYLVAGGKNPGAQDVVLATDYAALEAECDALRAQLPIQGGEAVEVVAYIDDGGAIYTAKLLEIMSVEPDGCEPLMAVAQHQRILAASAGSDKPIAWREHSVNYAKGEKCPETIETLQAAWDRDQELIDDMRHEIARHKTRINRLEQRRPAGQVAEAVAWLTSDKRHLVFSGALDQSQYVEQGMTPLYTHPADQVADDLTRVKVSRELLVKLLDEGRRAETWAAQDELRALLAKSEGVKP